MDTSKNRASGWYSWGGAALWHGKAWAGLGQGGSESHKRGAEKRAFHLTSNVLLYIPPTPPIYKYCTLHSFSACGVYRLWCVRNCIHSNTQRKLYPLIHYIEENCRYLLKHVKITVSTDTCHRRELYPLKYITYQKNVPTDTVHRKKLYPVRKKLYPLTYFSV